MQKRRGWSIQSKLGLLVALATGLALGIACTLFVVNDYARVRNATLLNFTAVADVLGANTVAALTFSQPEPAEEVLSSLRFEPRVEVACVFDRHRKIFATYRRAGLALQELPALELETSGYQFMEDGRVHIVAQIDDADDHVGAILLRVSMDHLRSQVWSQIGTAVAVLIASLTVSHLAFSALQRRIVSPILVLAETAERISTDRDYSVRVRKVTEDELGSLFDAFNRMLDEIQNGESQLRCAHEDLEARVVDRTQQLMKTNLDLAHEIAERERAEQHIHALQEQHLDAARRAGMADVATGVLHNIGNVLNSVNVSVSVTRDKLLNSRVTRLGKATELLTQHRDDLGTFLTTDVRGRRLPDFLEQLSQALLAERDATLEELGSLESCVDHIKEVVNMQQSFAMSVNMAAPTLATELMEDAVKFNDANFMRHGIEVVRRYEDVGTIVTDRHKVLQILINLISNSKHALKDSTAEVRRIELTVARIDDQWVQLSVADNGVGIPPANLDRIFSHGFTTKKSGHGFGLHSAALAASELGGALRVDSAGLNCGACFMLDLPATQREEKACPA